MKLFNKVVILGTGLIGGSLGLALKKKGLAGEIIGISRKKKNVLFAKKIGAIDQAVFSLDAVKQADLLVLAAPVDTNIDYGSKAAKDLNKDCLVIDVSSTKQKVVEKLSSVLPFFVGCHPLAGSEKSGIRNAAADIFSHSICILTPEAKTKKNALKKIKLLWAKLGAKTFEMSPGEHDRVLGFTSHLPHAVAFSLSLSVPEKFMAFSSGGLKDTTRIAASGAELWAEIFLNNRSNLLQAIGAFEGNLAKIKSAIKNKNQGALLSMLSKSKQKREKLG